jgi:hypothetical protein
MKRPWLAAGAVGVLAIAVTGALVLSKLPGRRVISEGNGDATSIAAPEFTQPAWQIDAFPAGAAGKITKNEKEMVAKQRGPLQDVVTSVYDSLFLQPAALEKAVKSSFAKGAAEEMMRTHAGLSPDASEVRIARRVARIGIEADGARLAAAKVKVVARAEVAGHEVEIKHSSILWLQRASGEWKVIGFEVDQGPVDSGARATKNHDRSKGPDNKRAAKSGKKNRP